jgi:hypothetical protein
MVDEREGGEVGNFEELIVGIFNWVDCQAFWTCESVTT